jgi:hypothetical protein
VPRLSEPGMGLIRVILVNIMIKVYLNLNIKTLGVTTLSFIYLYFYLPFGCY